MRFADVPIRQKLLIMALVITAIVLLASCAILVVFDLVSLRKDLRREFGTLGDVIAANSSAALAFGAQEDAAEMLRTLSAERSVTLAALYDASGRLFASYGDAASPARELRETTAHQESVDGKLVTYRPIAENGKLLGVLVLYTDLRGWRERLWIYIGVSLGVVGLAFAAATVFSGFLRKSITQPVDELARVAKLVSAHGNFKERAHRFGNDELGELTDTFNQMLNQIREREDALRVSEAQILRLNADLEKRVVLRTAELEDSNRNLEAFAYSVSHDLRAPLRIISGYAEVLLEDRGQALPEDHKMCLGRIVDGARRMNRLIDDLLHFSRLGQKPINLQTTSIDHLIDDVMRDLERDMKDRRIEWKRTPLPTVQSDPSLMRQVISNLLSNALKYTRPRDPTIIEIGHNEEEDADLFYVRDNGVGFDAANSPRLFGVFQRLHSAQEFEGNGVGLAMASRIVRRHGGRIWAESKEGQGATFYFTIPKVAVVAG